MSPRIVLASSSSNGTQGPSGGQSLQSYLKAIRAHLGKKYSTRAVQEKSKLYAERLGRKYQISHSWLTQMEQNRRPITAEKLYTLCGIYNLDFTLLLAHLGLDPAENRKMQLLTPAPGPRPAISDGKYQHLPFPLNLAGEAMIGRSRPLGSAVKKQLALLLKGLDPHECSIARLSPDDEMMRPLFNEHTTVVIDHRRNKVPPSVRGRDAYKRIYYLMTRSGYRCCHCQLKNNNLLLVPHTLGNIEQVRADAVDVVGEVIAWFVLGQIARTPEQPDY